MKIYIDAGHNPTGAHDTGATRAGVYEQDLTYDIATVLSQILTQRGIQCRLSRPTKATVLGTDLNSSLQARARQSNDYGADLFLSIHANATNDDITTASGVECYVIGLGGKAQQHAAKICDSIATAVALPNRGVKVANYAVLRNTHAPAVLIECGFINNPSDRDKMARATDYAQAIANAIVGNAIATDGTPIADEIPIIGAPSATITQMKQWAIDKNAATLFVELAEVYYELSVNVGIDPIVTYCQSAKETGYMKFTGVLDASYHNPCGMKTQQGGGDYDASAHMRFASWQQGIQAQVDHLALYAGAHGYPRVNTPDPRHFAYLHGTAKTVQMLGGRWAPSPTYGSEIARMMREVYAKPAASASLLCSDWALQACKKAVDNGVVIGGGDGYAFAQPTTLEQVLVILDRVGVL